MHEVTSSIAYMPSWATLNLLHTCKTQNFPISGFAPKLPFHRISFLNCRLSWRTTQKPQSCILISDFGIFSRNSEQGRRLETLWLNAGTSTCDPCNQSLLRMLELNLGTRTHMQPALSDSGPDASVLLYAPCTFVAATALCAWISIIRHVPSCPPL